MLLVLPRCLQQAHALEAVSCVSLRTFSSMPSVNVRIGSSDARGRRDVEAGCVYSAAMHSPRASVTDVTRLVCLICSRTCADTDGPALPSQMRLLKEFSAPCVISSSRPLNLLALHVIVSCLPPSGARKDKLSDVSGPRGHQGDRA